LWEFMYYSIQGILQFQIFQIPLVGADTCGFNGNTDEELCNRWMQLSAFAPFYRNHNIKAAISQEPFRWDSVAEASRIAIAVRYSLLPYWYSLFANASTYGTPPVRALFFNFPDEPELFSVDRQFMLGNDILITPVLTPNATTVDGIFPGRGSVVWRDWYTQEVVDYNSGTNTTLDAPLSHINVHVRDSAAILLHAEPGYTTTETREGPYALLVSQASDGYASGWSYIDDGESYPPTHSTTLTITASAGQILVTGTGSYDVQQQLTNVTVLGATPSPSWLSVQGHNINSGWEYDSSVGKLSMGDLALDLNSDITITWG